MNKKLWRTSCLAAALGTVAAGQQVHAQTNAVATGNWHNGPTWSAGVPTDSLPATINGGFTVTVDQEEVTNALGVGTVSGQTGNLNITAGDLTVLDTDGVTEPNTPAIALGLVAGATGNFTMSGGNVYIDGAVPSGFGVGDLQVGVGGAGTLSLSGGTITAADEIVIGQDAGSTGTATVSGGLLKVANRNLLVGFGGGGTFNLSQTGNVEVNGVLFSSFLGSANSTINQTGGTLAVSGDIVHGRNAPATINHSSGSLNGTRVLVVGDGIDLPVDHPGYETTYNISGNASVNIGLITWLGAFPKAHGVVNQSGGTFSTGALTVGRDGTGEYNLSAGTATVTGTDGWAPNNHLIVGGVGSADDVLKGDGEVHQTGGTMTITTGVFLGNFDNTRGVYKISGGTLNVTGSGSHANPGDFEQFIGDFSVGGALASNAVTTRVDSANPNDPQGQALDANGVFIVSGSAASINIAGNFLANPADKHVNRKSLSPGDKRDNSATLGFEIFSASGTSLINVAGIADLDGAVIDIDLMSGFTPTIGATFDLLKASSFGATGSGTTQNVGTGKGFTLASEDVGAFSVAVVPGGGGEILRATFLGATVPNSADFNGDDIVDGKDFLIWQRGFGAGGTSATGDANNDTLVNGADLTIWKSQFGTNPATPVAAAVPEPASATLVALGLVGLARLRRRK